MSRDIAVIGSGYWGKNIVRNVYELGRLRYVCDTNELLLKEIKKTYPEVEVVTEYEKVLSDERIKGVMIATPAVTHYRLAKEALKREKNVFVEKPLSVSVEEGEELVSEARKRQLRLMVGHILQYHPAVRKIKDMVFSGELGKVYYIYSNRLNIGKIRTEENILWSFAPHDISL
ncbi:MAG: Gfo/Idh/MocA family oxidoreductase, partial [Deltaproteobacteria bacterium]|nr:Gfo/Idh/MocA family oxidoreductase [Deltaproteobacteria bacterium]